MANEYEYDGEDNSQDWLEQLKNENNEDGEEQMVLNPVSVRQRIDAALQILGDFSNRSDKSVSRQDILANLARDLSEYYGYIPDLVELLLDIFSPAECVEYMDASDRPRPLVIRANTLKITRKDLIDALSKRGVNLEAVEWSKVAIKVTESSIPIGATPEYLAGYYMLQAAASLNPVMALGPIPGERVLDMSAAPGGKTSYIAQLMKNSGTVLANDLKAQRQKATVANLHRLGVKNTIVCCYDGRKIPKMIRGFDRVLLDAPCSGLGIISRDQSVKLQRTMKDVQRLAHLQKELLCAAVDACDPNSKTGGIIVYSTCSISTEENEQVVQYILQKRHVRLIETGLEVGRPGFTRYKERRFHPSLALTRRFYPHVHNMDGFYVAKFKKYANGPKGTDEDEEGESNNEEENEVYSDGENNELEESDESENDDPDDNDDHNDHNSHTQSKTSRQIEVSHESKNPKKRVAVDTTPSDNKKKSRKEIQEPDETPTLPPTNSKGKKSKEKVEIPVEPVKPVEPTLEEESIPAEIIAPKKSKTKKLIQPEVVSEPVEPQIETLPTSTSTKSKKSKTTTNLVQPIPTPEETISTPKKKSKVVAIEKSVESEENVETESIPVVTKVKKVKKAAQNEEDIPPKKRTIPAESKVIESSEETPVEVESIKSNRPSKIPKRKTLRGN